MKDIMKSLPAVIIALVILVVMASIVIVQPGERGVVVNLGAVSDEILDEGLHFRVPIVTVVKKLTVRIQKDILTARAATKDLQYIESGVIVNWKIDPEKTNRIYQTIGDERQIKDRVLQPAVEEVVKASTALRNAEMILVERADLKAEIERNLDDRLSKHGIIMLDVSLVNFEFSAEFNKAIEEKQIAEQEAKKAQFIADKAKMEAEAQVNIAKGESEAKRLINKELTQNILALEFYKKWDGKLPEVYVMGKDDNMNMLLPIGGKK
ncbi:MAG TPA: prohibitin family protein [Firmicutes bacterium]|nr:prohibitin family protein [Bacillota bacterium]